MALVMTLLTKVVLLAAVVASMPPFWGPVPAAILVVAMHVLSRFAPLVLMHNLAHVGLAASSKTLNVAGQQLGWRGLITGALWTLPIVALLWWFGSGWLILKIAIACSVTTWLLQRWLRKRLGGMTGDCLGACQQLNELAVLLAVAVHVLRPVL